MVALLMTATPIITRVQDMYDVNAAGVGGGKTLIFNASTGLLEFQDVVLGSETTALATDVLYSSKVTGDTQPRFQIKGDGRMEWGPGNAVTDVFFYRTAAGVLRCDQTFWIGNIAILGSGALSVDSATLATTLWVRSKVTGDFTSRFVISADGKHEWGDGANPRDIALSRSAAGSFLAQAVATNYTGTLSIGSAVVPSIASTTGIAAGMNVSGTGIPASTTVLSVDSATQITLSATATVAGAQVLSIGRGTAVSVKGTAAQGTAALFTVLDNAGSNKMQVNQFGNCTAYAGLTVQGTMGGSPLDASFSIYAGVGASKAMIVRGAASQASDLTQWMDNSNVVLSRISKAGYFITAKKVVPADADLNNSELAIWLDDTAGATKAMFKAKDSAGTVRTAAVALA